MELFWQALEGAWNIISNISFIDIIDIAIVSFLFYYIYKFIRERRAGKLAAGVLFMLAILFFSDLLEMHALRFILQNIFQVGVIAFIILFQPELRTALEQVGAEPLKSLRSIGESKSSDVTHTATMIAEITEAVCDMSMDKTGALIVIERSTKLGDIIASGTVVNANPTAFLIRNIFFNKAPLHDGAMVIRDDRIWAAGCFLPLSTNGDIIKDLGTRHRAAIGMSENSDAVVIVVSEETGTISIAIDGQLRRNFSYNTLKAELTGLLITEEAPKKSSPFSRFTRHDMPGNGGSQERQNNNKSE
ncbi:MAG: diadenylate cyclase CdaA [Clostridia bacterium]|nr:diadenylate cyclase CdaA [Clostridia bacterium]